MSVLAGGMDYVDLNFLGRPGIIATAVLKGCCRRGARRPRAVDARSTGSVKALDAQGIAVRDVRQILLTHIHLDHAGATGTLLQANPEIEVFVHERGARHLIDPSKLMASATRLYGEDMDRLWGAVLPVPAARVKASARRRTAVGRRARARSGADARARLAPRQLLRSHRAAWRSSATRPASGGAPAPYVMPPTPPPDIDLEAWRVSADRILAWDPDTLFLTHFGPFRGARTALPGALRAAGRLERARPAAAGGLVDRRRGTRAPVRRGRPSGHPADGGRS